jgi:hypothetical protein
MEYDAGWIPSHPPAGRPGTRRRPDGAPGALPLITAAGLGEAEALEIEPGARRGLRARLTFAQPSEAARTCASTNGAVAATAKARTSALESEDARAT